MAPAAISAATTGADSGRVVFKGGAGGRGRQAGHVDIVLHREGNAVERQPGKLAGPVRQLLCLGDQFGFRPAGDPDGIVAIFGNAREDLGDDTGGRRVARLIGGPEARDI